MESIAAIDGPGLGNCDRQTRRELTVSGPKLAKYWRSGSEPLIIRLIRRIRGAVEMLDALESDTYELRRRVTIEGAAKCEAKYNACGGASLLGAG